MIEDWFIIHHENTFPDAFWTIVIFSIITSVIGGLIILTWST